MHCDSCQTPLPAEARFCLSCGARVALPAESAHKDPLPVALEGAIGGQYEVGRLLGRGAMGSVYLAREKTLDRLVAIKALPSAAAESPDSRERFRREARTAARLSHPNIVPLHAFGAEQRVTYFVMGYVRGESLGARLRREGRLPPEEARRIFSEIADALDYAHRQGVVHRDVKPDNVLLEDETGRALLTDFGIAKARGAGQTLTESGTLIGTPSFMSPEQASGKSDIDGRSDLYSLGVMGYLMLSGRLPFEGDARDVLVRHMTEDPQPLEEVAPGVSADLAAAITRSLNKDPSARFPDGRTLREALGGESAVFQEPPDVLCDIEPLARRLAVSVLAAVYLALFQMALTDILRPYVIFFWAVQVLALVVAVAFSNRVWRARAQGISWRDIFYWAYRQPAWWRGWYPKRLRRPGDVWPRLPGRVRLARDLVLFGPLALAAFVALVLLAAIPAVLERPHLAGMLDWLFASIVLAILAAAPAFLLTWVPFRRRARQAGLDSLDRSRFLTESTFRPQFWRKPPVASLLEPERPKAVAAEPRSPQEYLQAIRRAADALSGPAREGGAEAVSAARDALSLIEDLDRRIAQLCEGLGTGEAARLEERLGALGPEQEGEAEERKQVRELLSKHLDLMRRLEGRVEEAVARRSRIANLLRELWTQVRGVRDAGGPAGIEASSLTDRIRSLRAEIEQHGRAAAEGLGPTAVGELPTLPS